MTTVSKKPFWHRARPWQTNAALLLFGTGLVLLSRQLVVEYHHFTLGFSGVSGLSALLYIASVLLVLTQPVDRLTLPIVLVIAVGCRIAPPSSSSRGSLLTSTAMSGTASFSTPTFHLIATSPATPRSPSFASSIRPSSTTSIVATTPTPSTRPSRKCSSISSPPSRPPSSR